MTRFSPPARRLFILLGLLAYQSVRAQVPVYLFIGPQAVRASYHINGQRQTSDAVPGVQAGVSARIDFDHRLYFVPAVYYSLKGFRVAFDRPSLPPDALAMNNHATVHTLEMAPLLQYDFSDRPGHFFVRLGPSLDFQLYGRERFQLKDGTVVERRMLYDFTHYGRYAASAIGHAGYENGRMLVYLQYTQGLTNLDNTEGGPVIQYRAAGITIARALNRR